MGRASFIAAHVSLVALMDSLVNILIPARTWPSTNTAVEDSSNLRVTEPHTPSLKSLMEPVKTRDRSLAASLILSPNYCWGHTTPCIPMASHGQTHSRVRLAPGCHSFCSGGMEVGRVETGSSLLETLPPAYACTIAHTGTCSHDNFTKTHPHSRPDLHPFLFFGFPARKLISRNTDWAKWGFLCVPVPQMNRMKNHWAATM